MTHIVRPADNLVLEFKENTDLRRKVLVYSTEDPDRFKIVRGLNAENHLHHTSYGGVADVKTLWIDSVVNGFRCVKNEIFPKGVKDCLPPSKEDSNDEVKKIYDGMVETGILPVDITKDGYINGEHLVGEPPIS
jgi:hypothetical protein